MTSEAIREMLRRPADATDTCQGCAEDLPVWLDPANWAFCRGCWLELIDRRRQRVDDLSHVARTTLSHRLALGRERFNGQSLRLFALNPEATLGRGYAIVRQRDTGQVVSRVAQASAGDRLSVRVSDGRFESIVQGENE